MPDFNVSTPPLKVTNPNGPQAGAYVFQPYPAHMHKWNEPHCVVHNDEEKAARKAEGWAEQPVLVEPKKHHAAAPAEPDGEPVAKAPKVARVKKPKPAKADA